MTKALFLVLALTCANGTWAVTPETSAKADFYVALNGADHWSGTLPAPNGKGTDGPFATLTRARDAVRRLKERKPTDIVVLVREGTYRLAETVVFGLKDSGEDDSTVTYAAYSSEKPVFSSARQITGWRKVTGRLPGLPEEAQGHVWVAQVSGSFFTLYDVQGLLPRARAHGFTPLEGGGRQELHFPAGTVKNWPNLEDVEIVIRPHHAWVVNILPLASVDEDKRIARTAIPGTYALNELSFMKGTESCWVENVLEALDEPGEWVLNSREGVLYLWPRQEGRPEGIAAPRLRELVRVEGLIDKQGPKDAPVRNLCLRGLTFMHGERYLLTEDDAGLQHDWDMHDKDHALVRLRSAENCVIEQCHFVHSGGGAIRVDLHGQNNRVVGNHIEYIGGTGILLCGYGPGTKDVNKNNLVYNNHIHHTGGIYWHSPGIFLWQSGENRVANNLIHHTPYSAMIVSGCMTHFFAKADGRELVRTIRWHEVGGRPGKRNLEQVRPFLHTHDNLVEYNEIHHAMEKLGDGNGIYVRGAGAGNVIRRNVIHHLVAPTRMQAAIRTDGGQRDTLIAENLIYRCTSQGIKLKLNNRAENNIIADILATTHKGRAVTPVYFSLREGPMTGAVIQRNILYHLGEHARFYDQGTTSRGRKPAWSKDADTDYNIYYCTGNTELAQKALGRQQRDGVDAHSRAVDPFFVDPENADFRFKADSPALKLGIVPIDISKIGLRSRNSSDWESKLAQR